MTLWSCRKQGCSLYKLINKVYRDPFAKTLRALIKGYESCE